MAKLGTKKRPAVVRVRTMERAAEILSICKEHGWKAIAGIEPEDITDVERLLNPEAFQPQKRTHPNIGRNVPCFCGSGKKYKKCCLT